MGLLEGILIEYSGACGVERSVWLGKQVVGDLMRKRNRIVASVG